jgi:hypothetical protein
VGRLLATLDSLISDDSLRHSFVDPQVLGDSSAVAVRLRHLDLLPNIE